MGPADTPTLRAGLTKVGVGSRGGSVAARAGPAEGGQQEGEEGSEERGPVHVQV